MKNIFEGRVEGKRGRRRRRKQLLDKIEDNKNVNNVKRLAELYKKKKNNDQMH